MDEFGRCFLDLLIVGCFSDGTPVLTSFSLQRFLMMAVAGSSVLLLSFGPFIVNVCGFILCLEVYVDG